MESPRPQPVSFLTTSFHTMKRSHLAVLLAVVALVGVLFLPVDVPVSLDVPGKIMAAREWTLLRNQGGSIGAMLRNHTRGTVQSYALNQFERGDVVRLTLHPAIQPRVYVEAGDTIASISSNETERQLAQLTGELSAATASLDLYTAGEKPPVVDEARVQLARAEELALQNEREVARLRALRERDLIAERDLETAESQQRVLETDIAAARARLDVVQTGAKPQQLDLTRARAAALQNEIATLRDRINQFTMTTPIPGTVVRSFGPDTLLQVLDTRDNMVVMPVPWSAYHNLVPDQVVEVEVSGVGKRVGGRLRQIGETVHLVNGQQVILVTASVDGVMTVPPGAMAWCTIHTGSVSLREYLMRMARSIF